MNRSISAGYFLSDVLSTSWQLCDRYNLFRCSGSRNNFEKIHNRKAAFLLPIILYYLKPWHTRTHQWACMYITWSSKKHRENKNTKKEKEEREIGPALIPDTPAFLRPFFLIMKLDPIKILEEMAKTSPWTLSEDIPSIGIKQKIMNQIFPQQICTEIPIPASNQKNTHTQINK